MCSIYRIRNDCLCWLFLVAVDIIRDLLPQVNELTFCAGIVLGRCIVPSTVFSCAIIWYKMSHLKLRRRWKILRASQCYGNLLFASINVSFRETVPLKTFPLIFPHPNFIKMLLHSMYQMVQMLSLYIVYFKFIPHFKFYCNFCIHNFTIKCC